MDETCGNAIAVSNKLLLCALHSEVPEGTPVELVDIRGTSRTGKVIKSVFESMKFDMTLIQIDDGQPRLPYCIPVHRKAIESSQDIKVIGLITAYNGDSILATHNSQVFAIEPDSSLFRATYYGAEGFSGAGIIVVTDNNRYELVGVHVATHDVTERPPVIKKSKSGNGAAAADSVEDAVSSLSSGLHRHMAYCLASEPFRIKKIFELLS